MPSSYFNKKIFITLASIGIGASTYIGIEFGSDLNDSTTKTHKLTLHPPISLSANAPLPPLNLSSQPKNTLKWRNHTVQSGETLGIIFEKMGISGTVLQEILGSHELNKTLVNLKPKEILKFGFNEQNEFVRLLHPESTTRSLSIEKNGPIFETQHIEYKPDIALNYAQATITSSFWNAADKAGLTANQIMQIAELFGWDIDFALDLRKGDRFSVLFEENYLDGKAIGRGHILAATFTNFGETFTAIRNTDGTYYNAQGLAMKKAFLRSPVNFRYVSSNFNPRRLHPVTGKVKPHRGTDYVAPVGTPIWSAGNGIVTESGYNQFNGHYVFIRHNSQYTTKYLHLSKRKVKKGQKIRQGEVIGLLGGTGRVTGPHLHYEFLVNGVHKNPRTVKLPQAPSLSDKAKPNFLTLAESSLSKMTTFGRMTDDNSLLIVNRYEK